MSDLKALRERGAAATGADRETDAALLKLCGYGVVQRWGDYDARANDAGPWSIAPRVTASLDAALALVEVKKPERALGIIGAAIAKFAATDAFIEGEPASKYLPRFMIAALLAALDGDAPNG